MIDLFKKDVGLCQNVLIGGVMALLIPYVKLIIQTYSAGGLTSGESMELLSLGLMNASVPSFILALMSIAFLAGFIIAGERRDRSAEFLAYLPPKRSTILASKAILCFLWIAIVAIVYFLVTEVIVPWISSGEVAIQDGGREDLLLAAGYTASIFGVSWLCSSFFESPVIAVIAGFVSPMLIWTLVYTLQLRMGWELDDDTLVNCLAGMFFILGLSSFVGGCAHFLLRVEP